MWYAGWGWFVLGTQSLTNVPNRNRRHFRLLHLVYGTTITYMHWQNSAAALRIQSHSLSLSHQLYLLRLECLQLWSLLQRAHAFTDVLFQILRRVFAFNASIFEIKVDVVLHIVLMVLLQLLDDCLLLRVILITGVGVRVHQEIYVLPASAVLRKHAQVFSMVPIQLISMFTTVKGLLLDEIPGDAKTKQYANDDREHYQHDIYRPVQRCNGDVFVDKWICFMVVLMGSDFIRQHVTFKRCHRYFIINIDRAR